MKPIHKYVLSRYAISIPFLFVLIFLPAWNIFYWQGWVYISLSIFISIISLIVLWNRESLLEKRMKPEGGLKKLQNWDKKYFFVSSFFGYAAIIFSILDVRFKWGPEVSFPLYFVAIFCYLLGQFFSIWARKVNDFLLPFVAIDKDGGHYVCQAGPYKLIRHPYYFGGILSMVGVPLILGSYLGIIFELVAIALLIYRTKKEDEFLMKELEGYVEYAKKVRYRLFWGMW
ncbi:MAG: methyltransferase family protein [Brevinematia bacterium]